MLNTSAQNICLQESGLSKWLGDSLAPLQKIPPFAITMLLSLLVATFTECSSNTATTTLFLPILASMVNRARMCIRTHTGVNTQLTHIFSMYLTVLCCCVSQAVSIKIHPLYVMLPCTIAASLAFMLPVATPPNAIAFSFGKLKVIDMVRLIHLWSPLYTIGSVIHVR